MQPYKLNTPTGTASYPHLTTPDTFKGKESYKCDLIYDASDEAVIAFSAKVDGFLAKAKVEALEELQANLEALPAASKNPKDLKARESLEAQIAGLDDDYRSPLTERYDNEGQPTGELVLKTKSNAGFTDRKTGEYIKIAPAIYDANAKKMAVRPIITPGSKLEMQISLVPYCAGGGIGAGVSCRILAVQVISLASGLDTGDGGGFGKKEGGFDGTDYVAPEEDVIPQVSSEEDSSSVY